MKTIFLVRHAKAELAKEDIADIDRALSGRGQRDANDMSGRLKEKGMKPSLIIASSAIRTTSTALIFARTLGYDQSKVRLQPDLYESNVEHYLEVLRGLDESCESVMLVGHNPTITDTANALTQPFKYDFQTCAVLALDAGSGKWADLKTAAELFFDFPKNGQG